MNARDQFKQAADSLLLEGDSDRAAELLVSATAVDPNQVANAVADVLEERAAQRGALTKLFTDYPKIKDDTDMQFLADHYTAAHIANGMSVADAITKAGEELGERFPDLLGAHSDTAKRAGQEGVIDDETPQSIMAAMRAARATGQGDENDLGIGNHDADASATIEEMRELRTGRARTSS